MFQSLLPMPLLLPLYCNTKIYSMAYTYIRQSRSCLWALLFSQKNLTVPTVAFIPWNLTEYTTNQSRDKKKDTSPSYENSFPLWPSQYETWSKHATRNQGAKQSMANLKGRRSKENEGTVPRPSCPLSFIPPSTTWRYFPLRWNVFLSLLNQRVLQP